MAVNSGTSALEISLKAIGIKPGDEIITSANTFVATVGAINEVGAKPVFVDIKEDYNINEEKIEKVITKKTKAIMPVHWSGRPCELKTISKNSLKIVDGKGVGRVANNIKKLYKMNMENE